GILPVDGAKCRPHAVSDAGVPPAAVAPIPARRKGRPGVLRNIIEELVVSSAQGLTLRQTAHV
ncbi:MAG: hypothetical protein LBM04_10985, partial [Opitutaceae bacterium]|nr:hypothetical protein [Opitutaceae bacterium]